jgi:hypothetical protein
VLSFLRSGARQLLAQAIKLEGEAFLAELMGETVLSGTVMVPNARSRRGSVLSRLPG